MREIKFRAWHKNAQEFTYLDFDINDYNFGWMIQHDGSRNANDFIFQQFTGHYCKGVEIYEGDILSTYCYDKPRKGAVVFGQDGWTCMGYHLNTGFFIGGGDDFKIIGNIYQNPDLLT